MPIHTNHDEAAMIAAILAGEIQLYHDLIRPYERIVYVMALSFAKNEADAEDIAQESFLKALCHLSQFRAESKFSTWLIRIALNEAKSRLRHQSTVHMESIDVHADGDSSASPAMLRDWHEIPSEIIERFEIGQLLRNAVAGLPGTYREVFVLRNVEDLSTGETAEALGISVASVKVRLHRARMMLQKHLCPILYGHPISLNKDSRGLTTANAPPDTR